MDSHQSHQGNRPPITIDSTQPPRASALGDELRAAAERGEPDDGSHYYHH
jgi:hypothetical protein